MIVTALSGKSHCWQIWINVRVPTPKPATHLHLVQG